MRRLPRISSASIIQLPAIQQGYYYYPLAAPGNGTYATIPINTVGTLIQLVNAPTANTWYLDFTGMILSVNYTLTITVLIPQGGVAYNPSLLINGIAPTLIGAGNGGTISRTNAYYYTIICTAPNQYSYTVWVVAI